MSDRYVATLRKEVLNLIAAPGSGGHVHFDHPAFDGLVPQFDDVAWVDFSLATADALLDSPRPVAILVELGKWPDLAEPFDITRLTSLEYDAPPAVYDLSAGSAYANRGSSGLFSDAVPQPRRGNSWISWHRDGDAELGVISLLHETVPPLLSRP